MRGNGLAGDDAALVERGNEAALGADGIACLLQADMRFQPAERGEVESFGNRRPLRLVGDKVEPLAIADLVEAQMMGETVGHAINPRLSSSRDAASNLLASALSAVALSSRAACSTSPLYRLARVASRQLPSALRHESVRLASIPTSLRTVLPNVGSPRPS